MITILLEEFDPNGPAWDMDVYFVRTNLPETPFLVEYVENNVVRASAIPRYAVQEGKIEGYPISPEVVTWIKSMIEKYYPGKQWYFNESVDLEEWLPCITTSPLEGQENPAYKGEGLVCAFDKGYPPMGSDRNLILAAPRLLAICVAIAETMTNNPDSIPSELAGHEDELMEAIDDAIRGRDKTRITPW